MVSWGNIFRRIVLDSRYSDHHDAYLSLRPWLICVCFEYLGRWDGFQCYNSVTTTIAIGESCLSWKAGRASIRRFCRQRRCLLTSCVCLTFAARARPFFNFLLSLLPSLNLFLTYNNSTLHFRQLTATISLSASDT